MTARKWIAAALVACGGAGCATPGSEPVGRAWYAGRDDVAIAKAAELLASEPEGRALFLNERGVVELCAGQLDAAYQSFLQAGAVMGSLGGGDAKEVGAILGSESSKVWRGDPYEQAMNSYYLGVLGLLRNDAGNALAGFKNAIFLDSSRGEEQWDCDFAPALFLEGLAWRRLGDPSMSERSLARARELAPGCAAIAAGYGRRLYVIVDAGRGPTKVTAGQHGEATAFVAHREGLAPCEVRADGVALGRTDAACDVHFQATTRGGRVFDRILRGKAIYKTGAQAAGIGGLLIADDVADKYQAGVLIAAAALLISSFAVDASADVRHWTTLPAEVQLFSADLPPGEHEIEVVPTGGGRVAGAPGTRVTIPPEGDVVVYRRLLP